MESQACTFDLTEERAVVQHIRDLLNFAQFLARGLEEEMNLFRKRLEEIGWGQEKINMMTSYAGNGTIYEYMVDGSGRPLVPRPIPEAGNQREWKKIKTRTKK